MKKISLSNSVKIASNSPRPVKIFSNSIRYNYQKNCRWARRSVIDWADLNPSKVLLSTLKIWYCFYVITYCFRDIISRKISAESAFFNILIANISGTVAQISINRIIFWKSVMRTFRCIYVNCFNKLSFLLKSAQNWKKCTFLYYLRTLLFRLECLWHWF